MFVVLRKKTFFNLMRRQYLQILVNARIGGLFRIRPLNLALSGTKKKSPFTNGPGISSPTVDVSAFKKPENEQYEILFTAPISGAVFFITL